MNYQPEPLNVSDVEIPPDLQDLVERLARNTHEIWAAKRLSEGWTYGPQRHDGKKEHPGLVPYGELSKGEKDYDTGTVVGVLTALIKLGYRIRKEG